MDFGDPFDCGAADVVDTLRDYVEWRAAFKCPLHFAYAGREKAVARKTEGIYRARRAFTGAREEVFHIVHVAAPEANIERQTGRLKSAAGRVIGVVDAPPARADELRLGVVGRRVTVAQRNAKRDKQNRNGFHPCIIRNALREIGVIHIYNLGYADHASRL